VKGWLGMSGGVQEGGRAPDGQFGAAGTPIFDGFLRELGEYNAEFAGGPFAAFRLYEKMRRSDAQVAGTLMACKLPIRCAEWGIVAPEDATPVEKEAAEFAEENLFESCDFEAAMENALLMLDFGCAAHEDVFETDGDKNRIRLVKMAPRLPLTFYRWVCKPGTDELAELKQLGYRAGSYVHATVPADVLTLFTFQKEGSNFAGRALTRAMYQHWYTKQALYVADAISCERNGMGVPVVTMGKDAKAEDKKAAWGWVQSLVTHEKTGLVLPPEWTFKLEGVTGTLRDPKESIAHHNMQIAMAGLAQFMIMGQSSGGSGNRSLGETMSDFFYLGLQATANQLAKVFSATTIRRLTEANFGEEVRAPRLVPKQIQAFKLETIVDALQKLSQVGHMTSDLETENWLREKLGAPVKEALVSRPAPDVSRPGAKVNAMADAAAAAGAKAALKGKMGDGGGVDRAAVQRAENAKVGANSGERPNSPPTWYGKKGEQRGVQR
jgi:phage gp29-like protein